GGWWYRNNIANFNLTIAVDGNSLRADYIDYTKLYPNLVQYMGTDGIPEVQLNVRDTNNNGRPDYEWRQLFIRFAEDADELARTWVIVNTQDDELPIQKALFWPYLGDTLTSSDNYLRSYTGGGAPIVVNWDTSRIVQVGEF